MDKDEAAAQILLSGSGDFVSLAEAAQYVRDDHPDTSADDVKSATLEVIRGLLEEGYVQVGELSDHFVAWDPRTALTQVEGRWTKADRELAPWDGVWLANTSSGDRLADELANDGRVTRREADSG